MEVTGPIPTPQEESVVTLNGQPSICSRSLVHRRRALSIPKTRNALDTFPDQSQYGTNSVYGFVCQ